MSPVCDARRLNPATAELSKRAGLPSPTGYCAPLDRVLAWALRAWTRELENC